MKRKEIWIGILICNEMKSDAGDIAQIFDSQEEALNWITETKECMNDDVLTGCSLYLGKISTAIDYARFRRDCRAMRCPIGPQGVKGVFTNSEVLDIMKLIMNNIQTIIVEEGIDNAKEE